MQYLSHQRDAHHALTVPLVCRVSVDRETMQLLYVYGPSTPYHMLVCATLNHARGMGKGVS
jgi:hypothetical protein